MYRLPYSCALILFSALLLTPAGLPAEDSTGADTQTAAAANPMGIAAGIAAIENEIHELSSKLADLQKQLEELKTMHAGEQQPAEAAQAAALTSEKQVPSTAASGLYAAEASQAAGQKPLPGRGATDKGLYMGLAAGAPEQRYGRGLFGDVVKIGGYGSFRYEANDIALGPEVGGLPRLKRGFNSFDFRRFVMTMDAAPSDRLRFYTEIEFERLNEIEIERNAVPENLGRPTRQRGGTRFIQEVEGQSGGEIAIEQAWAQFNFTDKLGGRLGVVLPPVGRFNILHDDDYWDIPRRPLVDRGGPVLPVRAAWRELGAGILGNIPTKTGYVDYQFYVVNGAQLDFTLEQVAALRQGRNLIEVEPEIAFTSGPFNGTKTANAMTWRLAVSPNLGSEFAFSGYHGEYTPDYLKQNAWVNSLGFDGKLSLGRFEVEGEFVYTDFGPMERVLNDIARQMIDSSAQTLGSETSQLETEIEGEFAGPLTNQRYGFWADFKYRLWPKWLDKTFLGRSFENPQLIPIFRWERIWFNDFVTGFDFSGGNITGLERENLQQQRTTLGLAYRPITSVVFTGAWEHNRRLAGSQLIFPRPVGLDPFPDRSYNTFVFGTAFGF